MKVTDRFQQTIADYLSDRAEKEPAFAAKLGNKEKSIEQCMNFILTQVQKSGRCGFTNEEVFGLAVHYYDEENPGEIKDLSNSCRIVGDWGITDEDREEARQAAIKRLQDEAYNQMRAAQSPKKPKTQAVEQPQEQQQLTLFAEL